MLVDRLTLLARASLRLVSRQSPWLASALLAAELGCSPAEVPAPPPKDPHSDARLQTATDAHHALEAQLAAASKDDLAYCRTNSGDCLISVSERREQLVHDDYLTSCSDPDPEKQSPCIAQGLEKTGKLNDLTALYEAENWCSRKLLECTADLQKDVARAAIRERARKRQREVAAAPKSVEANNLPELAGAKTSFLRTALPPDGQAICVQTTAEKCEAAAKAPTAELESELEKDDASYAKDRAIADYVAVEQAKAECYHGESTCLTGVFAQYGGNAESAKLLEQNLGLLEAQAHAKLRADADAAEQCVSENVIQNRDRIVGAYQDYVHDASSAPLLKLMHAFVSLHQAQLWCIQHAKAAR